MHAGAHGHGRWPSWDKGTRPIGCLLATEAKSSVRWLCSSLSVLLVLGNYVTRGKRMLVTPGWGSAAVLMYSGDLSTWVSANLSGPWAAAAGTQHLGVKVHHQPRGIGYYNINRNSRKSQIELWICLLLLDSICLDWPTRLSFMLQEGFFSF